MYCLGLLLLLTTVQSAIIQDLGGNWIFRSTTNGSHLPAQVPGGIYTDLMNNRKIPDVFYGFNDIETRWVSKLNWNYLREFEVNEDLLNYKVINLVFDGIDTFSKILVNNVEVCETQNMFVKYAFNIKQHLKLGNNLIEVQLKSAVNKALYEYTEQSKDYEVVPTCVPVSYNGECHVNHIRKMQASFAWDWGPALPSMGIWKPVYLEAYNLAVLQYVTVDIILDKHTNNWILTIYSYFSQNIIANNARLVIKLNTDTSVITNIFEIKCLKNKNGEFVAINNITVPKGSVHEWWPNGYGNAKLYNLQILYDNPEKLEKDKKAFKIGFRTIELVQDFIPNVKEGGRAFYFRVNGVPIFAKGSNIIPINILPEIGQNKEKIRSLLQSAKDVHMNMLRVWGGGIYESDIFYEIADELGILIWQDMMFACSMYPTKDQFLRNVQDEVRHQVKRLQYHPCIALWAGNNENEAALRQNWYNTEPNFNLYAKDYVKLYVDIIKTEILIYDSIRPFLTSSPTNGIESEKENHIAKDPQSHYFGDVHFYNYLLDGWNIEVYPIVRFASEYGYQSLPGISTLLTATDNETDLNIYGEFLIKRQHQPNGYNILRLLIGHQFNLPNNNDTNFFKTFVYYSQIIQAMAVKIETEHYRQWRSNLNSISKGFTMGALYWQLNDVWVAPTWAGIDYNGNWKMLHYFAKKFFAPIIVTGYLQFGSKLNLYVVSDLMVFVPKATVTVSVFNWNSFTPILEDKKDISIPPGKSQKLELDILNIFMTRYGRDLCGNNKTKCFIYMTLTNGEESIAPHNYIFPVELKKVKLPIPQIQIVNIHPVDKTSKVFNITIETTTISLFVWIDSGNIQGQFSENGFLQVTQNKLVQFVAKRPTTAAELNKCLSVTHL